LGTGAYDVFNKKFLLVVISAILFLGVAGSVQVDAQVVPENVFSIDKGSPILYKINPDSGATISSVVITLAGETVNGGTGLAFNTVDGKLYALLKLTDDTEDGGELDRHLVTIDPVTGVATLVGDTTKDRISGLTFNSGTLFSINHEIFPRTLSTISTVDGSVTDLCELGSRKGDLAFLPTDGLLYHAFSNSLERINDASVDPCDVTDIPLTGPSLDTNALVFRQATNEFLVADDDDELYTISANPGEVTFKGDLSHQSRGLAIITGFNIIQNPLAISLDPGNVLSIDNSNPILYQINPDTGAPISSVVITLTGKTVNGGTGLAFNTADGKLYALLKVSSDPGSSLDRHLVTIDPITGIATQRGDTGESRISGLTFNSGTLFSINFDFDTLSTISTVDGSVTDLCDLGSKKGDLAFLPTDGLLYHAFSENSLERIDEVTDENFQSITHFLLEKYLEGFV